MPERGGTGGAWESLVGHERVWWGMREFGGAWESLVGHGRVWWGMGGMTWAAILVRAMRLRHMNNRIFGKSGRQFFLMFKSGSNCQKW